MEFSDKIKQRLRELPNRPGVYIMRNRAGAIIYVGKALSLRKRVQSYFRQATLRSAPPKLRGLIKSIDDFEFIVTRTEAEATLTEGRLIKEYRPRYNVSFKDDKRFLVLRVNLSDPFPRIEARRLQKDDGATYLGPYPSSHAARAALEFVEKHFGLRQCRPRIPGPDDHRHCLNDIVRYCSAPCIGKVDAAAYAGRVQEACAFLRGQRPKVLEALREAMKAESDARNFEKAAALRDTLLLLQRAIRERVSARKSPSIKADDAAAGVAELQTVLGLPTPPRLIEAYDISNISGTHAVGSRVCALDGLPRRNRYRMFRIRTVEGSDDPRMMAEVIRRRFSRAQAENETLPDLVLLDGGITQLRAARAELDALGLNALPAAGLAKQFEEIHYEANGPAPPIRLPSNSNALKMLQRLRDEAHRFALTYHRTLRAQRLRESALDEIPGVGETRKALLLKQFGSLSRLGRAAESEIAATPGIGPQLAHAIFRHLHPRALSTAEEKKSEISMR